MSAVVLSHPVFCLMLTLLVFACGQWLFERSGRHPLLNPVAFAILTLIALLVALDIPYSRYFADTQMIHLLLGPATVALAVPLYRQREHVLRLWLPIGLAILASVLISYFSAVQLGRMLAMPSEVGQSLALKSVTVPVAMGISDRIEAVVSLTIVFVVITGNLGSIIGSGVLSRMGVRDPKVMGLALGATSHGQGAARAFQLHPESGAFAGLAMALTAIAASLVMPLIHRWFSS
ncbi:LrgB family protein [Ferrimonas balearica]|uniref:LrgB family protein n=1 Tax=Ferrimonas balearica TaxID=44012 RepID=UPI001C942F07|nr:LrgB family protein [Ferrimonas balearica]MBY6106806.1 LrgB family protein [Ferrimonas balearica]